MSRTLLSPHRDQRLTGTGRRALSTLRLPTATETLAGALCMLILYAACAQGAVQAPDEPRLQVGFALVAALAGAVGVWTGKLRLRAEPFTWIGVGLLAAFAVWSGVTIIWSVAPDRSWAELNRYITYVIALGLAISLGASSRQAIELIVNGFLVVVLAVTLYALGQKLLPGLHVPGLFTLNQTGQFPRLQQPFGYWNALALFVVMGVPAALMLVVDRDRPARLRLLALASLELMFLTIAFTYSRGGLIALAVGLAVGIWLCGRRLRSLLWIGIAAAAMLPPLLYGLISDSLSGSNISLSRRELAGAILLGLLLVSLVALILAGRRLLVLERTVTIGPRRTRAIVRGLLGFAGLLVVTGLVAMAVSDRGFTGTISHAWAGFTNTKTISGNDPSRYLSDDSGNRVVWWKEALGASSDRPVGGWGAGSFPVVHLLFRRNTLTVAQPHSVPLQWLAETGVIGALLAIGSFLVLLGAGLRAVRRLAPGRERMLSAALLAAGVAYAVHASYDWDSDIPGVTIPVLVLLGVLLGSGGGRRVKFTMSGRLASEPGPSGVRRPGVRLLAMIGLTLAMCSLALSAALPSLAATKASDAVIAAADSTTTAVTHGQSLALLASRLDPFSDAGLRADAEIEVRELHLRRAQSDLLAAVRRDPAEPVAWQQLTVIDIAMGDLAGGVAAAQRVYALNPEGQADNRATAQLIDGVLLKQTPPRDSATSIPTPASP